VHNSKKQYMLYVEAVVWWWASQSLQSALIADRLAVYWSQTSASYALWGRWRGWGWCPVIVVMLHGSNGQRANYPLHA